MEMRQYLDGWRERELEEQESVEAATRRALDAVPLVVELLRKQGARRVWLIGSLPRGTFEPGSDVDFMVEGLDDGQAWRATAEARERTGLEVDVLRAEVLDEPWRRHHQRYGRLLHG